MSKIIQVPIYDAMREQYLEYALSVIVGRALPDVRDGLKWVHRRIINEMGIMKLYPDAPYKKSARIVGNVLGKWHPHGDSSVYDSMVRLAQDFNMRYPIINGHGNWGSIDGDSPAHYRYTEAKLMELTLELLKDINKDTVNYVPNFDGEEQEPSILPARFPYLLSNGCEGIAVGYATAIPPHNLKDVIDSVIYQIDNYDCSITDLVNIIKAPDFPTCGTIINPKDMLKIYTEGHGSIQMRGKYHIEHENNSTKIVFTEIPYQVNKLTLVDSIYLLTRKKEIDKNGKKVIIEPVIPEISEVSDESDREGMRIVMKLKKDANPNKVLSKLFSKTKLQCNYGANFTAIHGSNLLEHMNLKDINKYYINHQKEVITRRTQFDLNKANDRLHILEGLLKALDNIDVVIEKIKSSKNKDESRNKIMEYLNVDEKQANYIIEIKLYRLAGMEIDSFKQEYDSLIKYTNELKNILSNEQILLEVLKKELIEIRDKYGDERKTKLIYEDTIQDISREDLIEDGSVTLCLTKESWLKKSLMYADADKHKVKEGDEVIQLYKTTNKSDLLMFTNQGRMFVRKVYDFEEKKPSVLGEYLANILDLNQDEKVIYICTTKDYSGSIYFVYKNGKICRTPLTEYKPKNNRQKGIKAYNTSSKLISLGVCENDTDIFLLSNEGKGTIIESQRLTEHGAGSQGMKAIELSDTFNVVGAKISPSKDFSFIMKTIKDKEITIYLDDIAETAQVEKSWYDHLRGAGSLARKGNFIYNCREKNDKIVEITTNK